MRCPIVWSKRFPSLPILPLAQGLLTGKFGADHTFPPEDNRAKNKLFQGETYQRAQTALDKTAPDRRSLPNEPWQPCTGMAGCPTAGKRDRRRSQCRTSS